MLTANRAKYKPYSTIAVTVAMAFMVPLLAPAGAFMESSEELSDAATLRIGFLGKVDSLNPNVGQMNAAKVFYGLVYDCLQSVGNDLDTVPNLAVDWRIVGECIPYGSAWEFDITSTAYWHDGEPLTADDVVFTINLHANNYTTMWYSQPYACFMDYAEMVDGDTVRIHFYNRSTAEPMPVAYADSLYIPILPEHMLRGMTPTEIAFNWMGLFDDSSPPIVGSGPFMATDDVYAEWLQGDNLTLVKNPNYHGKYDGLGNPEVSFDALQMCFFDSAPAMANALEMGDIDVAQFPPFEYTELKNEVLSGEVQNIVTYDGLSCAQKFTRLSINQNIAGPNPSRLDPIVRQALAMATNKQYINDNFYLGFGEPGTTLIPPVNDWHYEPTDDELYHYDIAAANALLEAGGYKFPSPEAEYRVCTADSYAVQENLVPENFPLTYDMGLRQEYPEEKDIAIYLQSEWKKIGVGIDYTIMTEAALGAYVYAYAYDTMIWYWSADVDPMYQLFCQSEVAWNGWNDNMYSTPEYEENFTASVQEFDEDLRREAVDNCQKVHYEDAYYIILSYVDQTYAWRTDTFTGWGDWLEHPGRSVDNFWTGNPLYFDLVPQETEEGEIPWLAIAAGVVVLAAAVVAIVFLKKRGGKKKEEKTSPLGE